MKKVQVKFFKSNVLTRTEIFSNEMEADLYIANEPLEYDFYVMQIGDIDVV